MQFSGLFQPFCQVDFRNGRPQISCSLGSTLVNSCSDRAIQNGQPCPSSTDVLSLLRPLQGFLSMNSARQELDSKNSLVVVSCSRSCTLTSSCTREKCFVSLVKKSVSLGLLA
ncbi:hypothetical protein GALMADRAFT_1135827 [Galerina marginata CBS 339.88]|uniref:Uncharacterized protein n=1 Tax=Galerina marginata (strain CBS 339.88) TaxID=685588 RepID=A0A067SJG7_GALM3|nr:hypothetical protein GALMADRAFT_1135827 [Galerina marginata CBS 339.88]